MDKKRISVGILFGGKSAEHEISLRSAKNVIDALDKKKYNPILIGIDKEGRWYLNQESHFLLDNKKEIPVALKKSDKKIALLPQSEGEVSNIDYKGANKKIDVIFPVLHGTFGEDGTVQGLLKLADIPFVGAGVLGSAVGMDKDIMKRLLRDAGVPIAKFLTFKNKVDMSFEQIVRKLKLPFFVKPANLGSSVGINKVKGKKDFQQATKDAFQFDTKIIIEEFIEGREVECAVLGNDSPIASIPGEIIVNDEFYSYAAKYINEDGAILSIPAKLTKKEIKEIQNLAIKTFKVLSCEGLGRVDCFLKKNGKVIVNEINTIPGFTSISMYPRLWKESGIGYAELIDKLIQFAIERFKKEKKLKTSY